MPEEDRTCVVRMFAAAIIRGNALPNFRTPPCLPMGIGSSSISRDGAGPALDYEGHFHASPAGYLVTDTGGMIQEINETLAEWVGQERRELIGVNLRDLLMPRIVNVASSKPCPVWKQKAASTKRLCICSQPGKGPFPCSYPGSGRNFRIRMQAGTESTGW